MATINALYFSVSYITLTCMYSSVAINFTWNMYKYHRFEFLKHIKRMAILYIATIVSSLYGCIYTTIMSYIMMCLNNGLIESNPPAFYETNSLFFDTDAGSICPVIVAKFADILTKQKVIQTLYLSLNFSILLPVFMFLLLD